MKMFKWAAVLCVASLTIGGCGGAASSAAPSSEGGGEAAYPDKGPLVVGTYGGTFDEALEKAVVKQFEEKFGVEVILDPSYDFAKLVAEGGKPSVDCTFMDDNRVVQGSGMGIFETLDLERMPNSKELYAQAIDATGRGIIFDWGRYGICYRTDKITTPPTSWGDLWNPEYAGKVTINSPKGTGGVQLLVMASYLNGGDEKNMDPGWTAMEKLSKNLLTVSATTAQLTDMLSRGDVWIAPWWDGRTYALKNSGVPVDFVVPKEGAFATINEFVIPVGAKNPNLAYEFINMVLDAQAQKTMAEIIMYGPVNKNTVIEGQLAQEVLYGAENIEKLIFCDWQHIGTVRETWIDRFDRTIAAAVGQ